MARSYRAREDGLFEVEAPGVGFMPVHWDEDELQAAGFEPDPGRTAFVGDTPQQPGPPAPPPEATDVPTEVPGAVSYQDWQRQRIEDALGVRQPALNPAEQLRAEEAKARLRGAPQGEAGPELLQGASPSDLVLPSDLQPNQTKGEGKGKATGPRTETYVPGGEASPEGVTAASRPRYVTTKARDVKAAWRVDKGPQLDPENEEFRSEAEIDARIGMQEQADREERRAGERAEQYESRVLAPMERQVSADELRVERLRREYAARQAQIDEERKAVDALEVDPTRVFSDKGAWASVLAGISIIAGGMLQGFQGRSNNPGLDAVNNAIDRDIQLQKDAIAKRERGLQAKETELERLTALYGSPEMAEAELRNRQMALAEAWAKHHVMKGAAEDVQLNLQKAFADRDLARVQERRELDQAFGDRVSEQWQHVPAQTVQVGGSRPINPKHRALAVVLPGGKVKYARSEVDARDARGKITAGMHLDGLLGNVQAMVERGKGDRLWWDENRGRIQANMTAIAATYKDSEKLGTFDAGVERLLAQGVGQPDAILNWDDATLAKIEENRRLTRKKIEGISAYELDDSPDAITPGAATRVRAESDR